jgi:hypothetical protein
MVFFIEKKKMEILRTPADVGEMEMHVGTVHSSSDKTNPHITTAKNRDPIIP